MAATLSRLLAVVDVAVISGGDWRQFDRQFASRLPVDAARERQWLMPTTGTKLYRFVDEMRGARSMRNHSTPRRRRASARRSTARRRKWGSLTWGELIEDRGSQIAFSGLSQDRNLEVKERWDRIAPSGTGDPEDASGGAARPVDQPRRTTSIDVTRAGVGKGRKPLPS